MTSPEIKHLIQGAEESHQAARVLLDEGFARFSTTWSCNAIFCLAQAMLLSKGLSFSRRSAVTAAYGREFAKTGLLDSKFHRYIIDARQRRQTAYYSVSENISDEDALESFEWAGEFIQAVKEYFGA